MVSDQELVNYRKESESAIHKIVRWLYGVTIRPLLGGDLAKQRFKMVWFVWGYWPILVRLPNTTLKTRLWILGRVIRIDWHVPHSHLPGEVFALFSAIATRHARPREVVIEAGCWQGGLSCKLSILCSIFGYRLMVYDSFEGVEAVRHERESPEFFGGYAAAQGLVASHITTYGEPAVCELVKGWLRDTLAHGVKYPVRVGYIDCDLVKATEEALQGLLPAMVEDGYIFSEDYHLVNVRRYLASLYPKIDVQPLGPKLARLHYRQEGRAEGGRSCVTQWPL
jgi:hypothetical protein